MRLNTLLRWLMCFVQPVLGWRVPVVLLRGKARVSGRSVTLLAAGRERWTEFIRERFFAEEPEMVCAAKVPVWFLQKQLKRWQPSADLMVVGVARISAWLFLGKDYLASPPMVSMWMDVPDDLEAYVRRHRSAAGDWRRTHRKKYQSVISRDEADFDLFYDQFYRPYICGRHGSTAKLSPRWLLRLAFKRGQIQWLLLNGERVAGDLVVVTGKTYTLRVTGLLDGRLDLLRQGAMAALYVHSIGHARQFGCTQIAMGGSLASLHDGVFRYKCKWSSGLQDHDGFLSANHVRLFSWNRLAGPVAEFLSHTSLVHHDHDGYSALWAFPSDVPLTADNLRREYRALRASGLRRFRILLPGDPPPDFDCPPEVRLINIQSVAQAGTQAFNAMESDTPGKAGGI
ncbi:GNAT family N-acetyltransferase [Prosthecobacter sp.]|uniref:GNAT family N-acetyltransferase n=1 Tax=Prosthecobacter sp. TaxID=1965333 RepID=UPI002AB9E980|nr:GNAT family N-acetyltransferase [Prosthecobacter sp.]MDZ4405900.1 GNAT family N-acetyltransferase [Prosthecobacter sp.]